MQAIFLMNLHNVVLSKTYGRGRRHTMMILFIPASESTLYLKSQENQNQWSRWLRRVALRYRTTCTLWVAWAAYYDESHIELSLSLGPGRTLDTWTWPGVGLWSCFTVTPAMGECGTRSGPFYRTNVVICWMKLDKRLSWNWTWTKFEMWLWLKIAERAKLLKVG